MTRASIFAMAFAVAVGTVSAVQAADTVNPLQDWVVSWYAATDASGNPGISYSASYTVNNAQFSSNANGTVVTGTSFKDFYTFQITPPTNSVTSDITNSSYAPVVSVSDVGISGLQMSLFNSANSQIGQTVSVNTVNTDNYLIASGLAPGSYYLAVTGAVSGVLGGEYQLSSQLAAVPIPGAALLFGSGLLGMAGISRHNRKSSASV